MNGSENERYITNKPDFPFAVHVSIMQQVMPVNLEKLSLPEVLVFLLGYMEDLSTFAGLGLWHDCHLGNLLMQKQKGKKDHVFCWHDFGGVPSGIHPRKAALEEFVRKMRVTINETAEMIHTRDPQITIPEPMFEVAGAAALQRDLREFTQFFRIKVMRSADESVRKAVLGGLTSVLSGEILAELERELIQSDLAQALSQL